MHDLLDLSLPLTLWDDKIESRGLNWIVDGLKLTGPIKTPTLDVERERSEALFRVVQLTSATLITQIREAPNIAQTDRVADAGQDELHFIRPVLATGLQMAVRVICNRSQAVVVVLIVQLTEIGSGFVLINQRKNRKT